MRATVSVPGHITGFFSVYAHEDPLRAGSRGCGVVVNKGVITRVKVEESGRDRLVASIDGGPCSCPVSTSVVSEMLALAEGNYEVEVRHELKVPMEQGFGTSGAGAIGVAMGLNEALSLGLDREALGRISHRAEVQNRTGMGDVAAIMRGGAVVREKEGAPGTGKTISLPWKGRLFSFVLGKGIETRKVLSDASMRGRITRAGEACLKELLEEPTEERFIKLSRRFTYDTGLATGEVRAAIEKLERHGIEAAMIMLGNSVFGFSDSPEEVCGLINKECIVLDVDGNGPKVVEREGS